MKVLEITPYEPPASGWVTRVKLLRRVIEGRGGTCEVLDIGPNRRVERPGCWTVTSGLDYLVKVARFARAGFTLHCHINGEYFRGLLLCVTAATLARVYRTRCVVTLHAGPVQPFFEGWRGSVLAPLFQLIFGLADAVVCNSEAVKQVLLTYVPAAKVHAIPAFSVQYLEYQPVELDEALTGFLADRSPVISTYLCFRDGFFTDTLVEALAPLVAARPSVGLVVVGTGPERATFEQALARTGLSGHVALAGDLEHDAFMTLLSKSAVHLRTPVTDGVSATVLEALSLRVPVVASANGTRPAGVTTYPATDARGMAAALDWALHHREQLAGACAVTVEDTAAVEVDLLVGTVPSSSSSRVSDLRWRTSAPERKGSA
jgi:glycosyltransferase involved in cell wall biosynthesis